MPGIRGYHAHVYFDPDTAASAEILRAGVARALAGRVVVHPPVPRPIGPHPLPMFEIDVPPGELEGLLAWLMLHHGTHSVLVHPVTGDDLKDHRDHPLWIGRPLPLNLDFLENTGR
ncbi:MAG: DOPA 4,5-dioxygenase family protein [Elusimicrobiota bacterium]